MKFAIPEISWHNRDPVLSVDFQPRSDEKAPLRLATGGTDSHILIWYLSTTETGGVNLEVAADLTRHQKAVNVVRWSPNGEMLASGDDESIIFVWKQKVEKEVQQTNLEGEEQYKESWVIYKTLRGHMEDVLDLSWSPDSLHLASGSVDNKLVVWDVSRGRYSCILSDHKGFVQGVAWDPKKQYIVTASSDRTFRAFDVNTKKVVARSSKAVLPFPQGHCLHEVKVRLYHDDTLQTFYRRLQWSPDGLLLAVPAGRTEPEQGKLEGKPINVVYIYTRYSLKVPMCVLPCGDPALAVRWSGTALRPRRDALPPPSAALPRHVLAVATRRSVLIYDTHQKTPIALISNIHYTRLTDLTWSDDGLTLVASSTDGFCSVITFSEDELGERIPVDTTSAEPMDTQTPEPIDIKEKQKPEINKLTPRSKNEKEKEINKLTPRSKNEKEKEKSDVNKPTPRNKIDSFIKFKAPSQKTGPKTPVKMDVLEEVAMPSWSDNSNNDIIRPKDTEMEVDKSENSEILIIEDSEDIKLVYDETQGTNSPEELRKSLEKSHKSPEKSPKSPEKSPKSSEKSLKSPDESRKSSDDSRKSEKGSISPITESSPSENTFLKQAKVTDVTQAAPVTAPAPVVPSPKAPRRVNFVTLSSPKNKKKK